MQPMLNIAVRAARSASRVLLKYFDYTDVLKINSKGKNDFVTEVDRSAEHEIINTIRKVYPDHAILGEETGAQGNNAIEWIIDPLDGTTNYLRGIPQFAISIAVRQKNILQHAVVYDPIKDELYSASRGDGAFLNDRRLRVTKTDRLDGAMLGTGIPFRDKTHLDAYLGMMKDFIKTDISGIRRPGSASLDLAYVASGRFDAFWELGLSPWDFAAGALLVREAGGAITDLAGGDRFFKSGNMVASNTRLHPSMLKVIQPYLDQEKLRF